VARRIDRGDNLGPAKFSITLVPAKRDQIRAGRQLRPADADVHIRSTGQYREFRFDRRDVQAHRVRRLPVFTDYETPDWRVYRRRGNQAQLGIGRPPRRRPITALTDVPRPEFIAGDKMSGPMHATTALHLRMPLFGSNANDRIEAADPRHVSGRFGHGSPATPDHG
jgi:hypothetical protein